MTPLKPFQEATVEAACRALSDGRKRSRRFLVADEVGLGKTVVAQHVLKRLMSDRTEPLVVFYVCSSLSIAGQNRDKLLQVLPERERKLARCEVDRLTLLPSSKVPDHPRLHLYSLTPDTSIPGRQGRRRDGRMEERALLQALVEDAYPDLKRDMGWGHGFFRRLAGSRWAELLAKQRGRVAERGMRTGFYAAVREAFDLAEGQWLTKRLGDLEDLEIIARFRNALALQALGKISPDLVIFDEFQRFRDLLDDDLDEVAARVVRVLRGDDRQSALLMLSATPYSLMTKRNEDANGAPHHKQLLDLVEFLYGRGDVAASKAKECREAFRTLERALYQGEFEAEATRSAVARIERLLSPIMARTERTMHPLGRDDGGTSRQEAALDPDDLKTFRHMVASLDPRDRAAAAAYWSSIPLPMQAMGARYEAWKRSRLSDCEGIPQITEGQRDRYETTGRWPHPKLRALLELVTPAGLALPWIAPSMPWWPLSGLWRSPAAARGKVLIFSRFRAVPPTVSAALSFELERKFRLRDRVDYLDVSKRRLLQATGERLPLLAAFHPCLLLARFSDPLKAAGGSRAAVQAAIRKQLGQLLEDHRIKVEPRAGRVRPVWQLIAGLERRAGLFDDSIAAWQSQAEGARKRQSGGDEIEEIRGLGRLVEEWSLAPEIGTMSPGEFDELVFHAMSSPGVVLSRAIARYWDQSTERGSLDVLLAASWQGLRPYFDQRWFAAAISRGERDYVRQLQQAIIDGNLESVLDEWFWLLTAAHGYSGPKLCEEIVSVAKLRGSDVHFHSLESKSKPFSIRAHSALPFVDVRYQGLDADASSAPLRNDALRQAFNSPFFPHVLTTTSVGQEGLDFHAWCRTIVHWDLAPDAADLEQREGRIQRFAGLAVRRAIASKCGSAERAAVGGQSESPWRHLADLAEKEMGDSSGLAPWWVCEGAKIDRCVFDVPTSQDRARLNDLRAQRGLYRVVLGQPHQEDLMAVLQRHHLEGRTVPSDLLPRLSPYFKR